MTLVELVIVLAILGLLAGLVAPRTVRWLEDWRLRATGERIAQMIRAVHTRAMFEQRPYLVEFMPRAKSVRVVEPESGFRRELALPAGIEWGEQEGVFSSGELQLLLPPSGSVEERTVWLRNRAGTTMKIHVHFLLGSTGAELVRQES